MYTNMHIEKVFDNMLDDVSYIKWSTYTLKDK
jgi:hypothetical protein